MQLQANPDAYIVVIEDLLSKRLVATASLLLERKFIRHNGMVRVRLSVKTPSQYQVGHIEDVVVDKRFRKHKLGNKYVTLSSYALAS